MMQHTALPIEVSDDALLIDGRPVPLFSGEMHFWRIMPAYWEPCLQRLQHMGLNIVATYLSWRRHSPTPDEIDLTGRTDPCLNLPGFLKLCQRLGLGVHLKPGPWICAEEINGGYPDWLLEDVELLVRDCQDRVVLGNDPPLQHPLPSYLHPRYLAHVKRWIQAVSDCIRPFCYPDGPVLLIQLDNEPSMAFHDGMFEADYHPLNDGPGGLYPQWLQERYGTLERLNEAHSSAYADFGSVRAPRSLHLARLCELVRFTDWAEFKEWLLAKYIETLREIYLQNGVDSILFTVNLIEGNRHEGEGLAVPNDWQRLEGASGLGGLDYYAFPPFDEAVLTRVARGVNYSLCNCKMAWAPELMAGLWLDDAPYVPAEDVLARLTEQLQLTALAYGLKGLNFYMLVNRELWTHAPITEQGQPTSAFARIKRVLELAQRLHGFQKSQSLAVMYYRPYAREAYVAAGARIAVEGVRLGESWRLFETLYAALVRLNYDPAIFDPHVNPGEIARYSAILVPSGPYMDVHTQNLLVEYATGGGRLILWGELPHLSDEMRPCSPLGAFVRRKRPKDALPFGDEYRVGDGRVLVVRAADTGTNADVSGPVTPEPLARVLRHCDLSPEVAVDTPGVFAVVQRNDPEAALFTINLNSDLVHVTLRFGEQWDGGLRRIHPGEGDVSVHNGETRIAIPGESVGVFIL